MTYTYYELVLNAVQQALSELLITHRDAGIIGVRLAKEGGFVYVKDSGAPIQVEVQRVDP